MWIVWEQREVDNTFWLINIESEGVRDKIPQGHEI